MRRKTRLIALTVTLFSAFLASLNSQPLDMSMFHGMEPRNIGPAGMSGRVNAIDVVLSNPDIIYIGSASGGVWKSENAGMNWTPISDDLPTAAIGDLAIYQKNPNIIYVGTGEGNPRNSMNSGRGMFKSVDGGRSWQAIGLENTRQIHRVIVHPDNPDVVWAGVQGSAWGTHPERGVYKSTDGGQTWDRTLFINDSTGIADLRIDPNNPNKLIAAMWEFRRWPWFFKSGGAGSGIYISENGGVNWEKIECDSGLPCSELGRIGVAFAPGKSSTVYAYVESKQNAIYRSNDGGYTWQKRSKPGDKLIGDRPFYYADLYVDVKNENRVYSIATSVTVSEDGGATWETFAPGNQIHTDHHAWWAHPENPNHLINGNDGGLFFTQDRGKNWLFVENLPLAQFYHMRVDNEIPYNVYGGLQDNGSWRGPSQTWFKGGIRNMYWQRLGTGDGFDVVPDPRNNDYGYAMGQAGNLVRYHRPSGQLQSIMPVHPDGEYLRFNWNAGIAINPMDQKTIYYGSQYVHKSSDYGRSWEIISPDLTTNDSAKQQFLETGGLTYDVTGAEFHTTIITIAPSPLNANVMWVGTDDGNVQLTRDGGESWALVHGSGLNDSTSTDSISYSGIPGVPANTWVPHIHVSNYNEGEAFVVFEDHRRNNWEPYVFHTEDYGQSWTRIVDSNDVASFVYVFVQDPKVENLWYCGTDDGLYVSIDAGENWTKWTNGYPTVPTMDMVVHPRDGDLVLGTFGRAFWILDDITPLRELASDSSVTEKPIHVFRSPDAYLAVIGESHGYREGKVGEFLYKGENRPYGALISFNVETVSGDADTFDILIKNSQGITVRNLRHIAKAPGVHRMAWDLSRNAPRSPQTVKPDEQRHYRGVKVVPGEYTITVRRGSESASGSVYVLPDPRLNRSAGDFAAKDTMVAEYYRQITLMTSIADELRALEDGLEWLEKRAKQDDIALNDERYTGFKTDLQSMREKLLGKKVEGIYRQPGVVATDLQRFGWSIDILDPVSPNQQTRLDQLKNTCAQFGVDWDLFKRNRLTPMRGLIAEKGISIF